MSATGQEHLTVVTKTLDRGEYLRRYRVETRNRNDSNVRDMIVRTLMLPYMRIDPERAKPCFKGRKDVGTQAVADHPRGVWFPPQCAYEFQDVLWLFVSDDAYLVEILLEATAFDSLLLYGHVTFR